MDELVTRRILESEMEAAKQKMTEASEKFDATIREVPSYLPQPDGTQRILKASKGLSTAREQYKRAFVRLSDFITHGTVPEDVREHR